MCVSLWEPGPFALLTHPIILLYLNLVETVDCKQIAAIKLRMLVQKRESRPLQDLQSIVQRLSHVVLRRVLEFIFAVVVSDRYLISLNILIENVVYPHLCECVDVEWNIVIKATSLLIKTRPSFFNDRVNELHNLRASTPAIVCVSL